MKRFKNERKLIYLIKTNLKKLYQLKIKEKYVRRKIRN